jgi:hypothetical protein
VFRRFQIVEGLTRVALAVHGMLPASGGLEYNTGSIGDIVSPKKVPLSPGMVEVMLMLRLNKEFIPNDVNKIPKLSNDWEEKIPRRECILDEVTSNFLTGAEREEGDANVEDDSADDSDEDLE